MGFPLFFLNELFGLLFDSRVRSTLLCHVK